ncbi:hypothetical protein [Nocardia brasiliensis]|uniref:hypothetical protein n=1 Tax=Nocardia brasiliensis TaxID=37326 RepID=UPI002457665C|nr:hypothetical protein [Nocardia brasiliensis]
MTIDTTGLREWTIDTDAQATYHLWLPPEAGQDTARATLEHYMYAGEHEAPFAEEVQLPDGRGGCIELVCAAPRRTGRALIDAAGDPYDLGPDDGKQIDGDWEGKAIAVALAVYDTATDLPARLAAARTMADTVRAAMIGGTDRPASATGDDQASALAAELTELADEFDRAAEDEYGGCDAEFEAAAALRHTARDAAQYLREVADR